MATNWEETLGGGYARDYTIGMPPPVNQPFAHMRPGAAPASSPTPGRFDALLGQVGPILGLGGLQSWWRNKKMRPLVPHPAEGRSRFGLGGGLGRRFFGMAPRGAEPGTAYPGLIRSPAVRSGLPILGGQLLGEWIDTDRGGWQDTAGEMVRAAGAGYAIPGVGLIAGPVAAGIAGIADVAGWNPTESGWGKALAGFWGGGGDEGEKHTSTDLTHQLMQVGMPLQTAGAYGRLYETQKNVAGQGAADAWADQLLATQLQNAESFFPKDYAGTAKDINSYINAVLPEQKQWTPLQMQQAVGSILAPQTDRITAEIDAAYQQAKSSGLPEIADQYYSASKGVAHAYAQQAMAFANMLPVQESLDRLASQQTIRNNMVEQLTGNAGLGAMSTGTDAMFGAQG